MMKKILLASSLIGLLIFLPAEAAITTAHLTSGTSSSSAAFAITSSTTPTANRLVLVAIGTTAVSFTQPTLTGNGMTWEVVATSTPSSGTYNFSLFRSMSASPSAGALSIDFGGNSQSRIIWGMDEFANVDTSGSNGSGAIVQVKTTSSSNGDTNLNPTISLSAFASSTNAAYGAVIGATNATTAIAPGGGLTEISDVEWDASDIRMQNEWKPTSTVTVDWVFTGGISMDGAAMAAVEIKETTGAVAAVATAKRRVITIFED